MAERIVKVIQPTVAQSKATAIQRAAAYCRVSTDSEDQANSFAAQFKYYTDYIKNNQDMEFVDIYADEGITGTCVAKRDEFKRMMRDAENGKLDRIFVKSVSRFARNSLECIESIRRLSSCGVTVLFENDNIDTKTMNSELILYVKSAFAQSEALAGSKRVSTAIRMRMENGDYITNNAPYGYRLDKETFLKIVPKEAEIVRYIYDLYLSGHGSNRIASILNEENRPSPSGRWSVSGVRYILTNEKYIGDSLLQKTFTPQCFPLRNRPNKGEVDKYYVKHTHEAIVSRDVFEAVQQRMSNIGRKNDEKAERAFFKGCVYCEECGWGYKRKKQNNVIYWVCSRKSEGSHHCGGKNIREGDIKKAFIWAYNKFRCFERQILDKTLTQLISLRKKVSGQNREILQLDSEIAKLYTQIDMYTKLHNQNIIDDVSFMERTSELSYKTTELRNRRLKIISSDEDEQMIESFKNLKETVSEYPTTILSFDPSLFADIVQRVLVGNDGTIVFILTGGLRLRFDILEAN